MGKKSVMISVGIILTAALCWAQNPFQNILSTLKDHASSLKVETQALEEQSRRLGELAIEIDALSKRIEYKDQVEKMERLQAKIDRLDQWVAELGYKADMLKELATKMGHESKMLIKKPPRAPGDEKCGPGKVWVPRQKSAGGQWIPGHCAPTY